MFANLKLSSCFQLSHGPLTKLLDCVSVCLQASSKIMDCGSVAGDVPALLRPCGDAYLCSEHGRALQLVQERNRHGAGQLLLGLLLHSGPWRLRQ